MDDKQNFVSRGGEKLAAALSAFGVDVSGWVCADLGCNVGGFTDCLLKNGAEKVYAVDTGYGTLAWVLRNDRRVVVMERTNVLHVEPPSVRVDLVVIDLGWTPQRLAVPAALRWRADRMITLIKPHYEESNLGSTRPVKGVLGDDRAEAVGDRTLSEMPRYGVDVLDHIRSPIRGGAGKGKSGNTEYLAFLRPSAQ